MKNNKGIEIQMVTCGNAALYNMYLPGNRHAPRLPKKLEDINKDIIGRDEPEGRDYLILETGGVIIESQEDYIMPPVKYVFRQ